MKSIETKIIINAKPEIIWNILIDFRTYPKWNPFITFASGDLQVGNILNIKVQPPKSSGMQFKPTILKYEKNRELRWIGKLFFKGLFDGEHYFVLSDNKDGTTTFLQGETFNGVLVPVFKSALNNTKTGFNLMNEALKFEAEKNI